MKKQTPFLLILLLFLCAAPCNISAQVGRFFSSYKEISNSLINQVYQDRNGFIWIATEDGLNRYDGTKFTVYRHNDNEGSIKNNYVHSILDDSQGRFWVGCINGLLLYDQAADTFTEQVLIRDGKTIHPHVTSIIEQDNGDILFATSGQNVLLLPKGSDTFQILGNMPVYVQNIYVDHSGTIWVATESNGIFSYQTLTGIGKNYKGGKGGSSGHPSEISSFCEDNRGDLYVGTIGDGLLRYDTTRDAFVPVIYKGRDDAKGRDDLKIKSLFCTKRGNLYIGTDGEGLKQYDPEKDRVADYNINVVSTDLSNAKVHSILEDKDGNLWLGLFQKGLVFLPKTQNRFDYYGYRSVIKNTVGTGCITAICTDRNGVTWVGTDTEGLFAIDAEGNRLKHYPIGNSPSSIPNAIMCIYETTAGDLLLGSFFNGLVRFDRKTGTCVQYTQFPRVMTISEDANGALYLGTNGSGMFKVPKGGLNPVKYTSSSDDAATGADELNNNWVNSIMTDREGLIWIGTYRGLACFDPRRNTFLTYAKGNNLLPDNIVSALIEDSDERIWIGTYEGLFCFSKKTQRILKYTTKDGLADNVICGLADDSQGAIWISTHNGLSKFAPRQDIFMNYNANDGLQGNEFSRGAVFKNKNGRILFGGTNGITAFNPWDIKETDKNNTVVITDFTVLNRSIKKGDLSYGVVITDKAVFKTDTFHLAAKDNTFSMKFSVMDYNNPERIIYQHKIKELGKDWIASSPGDNHISYSYLKPGIYTVQIRANDNDDYSPIKEIVVSIAPPWYSSWWGIGIIILIIILLFWMLIMFARSRYQHRKEALNMKRLEEINEAKLQYFMNISHEIRNPMTLIINPLEKIIKDNKDPELNKSYLIIYRNAQRILRLVNQLMDIRKIEKGQMSIKCRETNIVDFIKDLMLTFEYMARQKRISFEFVHDIPDLKVWIDLNNFDKVLLNIFSNAFKYAPDDGEIIVRLSTGFDDNTKGPLHHYYEISVTDNGIGIDEDKIEKIFDRFYQVPNSITNSYFSTGIGLHLAKSLVLLHHGTIKAENRKDVRGSIFVIRMPLGCEHLQVSELQRVEDIPVVTALSKSDGRKLFGLITEGDASEPAPRPRTKYKVLIVEDEFEIRHYIKDVLSSEYIIAESANGKEAMEAVAGSKPDLIISDIMMPEMDGITLCRKVKQNTELNDIPVILLTAKARVEDKQEGLEVGADSYIPKPFNVSVLMSTIANLLENRERLRSKFSGIQEQKDKVQKIELKSADEELMEKVMNIINENMSEVELSVEMIAEKVGYSRVHVYRKIKEITNLSARDFVKSIKLKQAATLLSEKNLSVSEVAYAVGYSNISHFSNSFKSYFGVPPKEYKAIKKEKG